MHRVDPNPQRAAILRIVAYSVTLTLTLVTTIVLLYFALGYRFDRSGHVTRTGLLLVDNRPEDSAVYINDKLKDGATPSRFVLTAGDYSLALKRDGYRDWSKQVAVAASGVREVAYPLLVPTKLSSKQIAEVDMPSLATQSPNHKLLLTHVPNASQMQLHELDPEKNKQTTVALPGSIKRENGQVGTFTEIEWALNNKHVLLLQTLPSGATHIVSLDVTKPQTAITLSSIYGDKTPSDVHYVGDKTDRIYGVKDGVLNQYSLEKNEIIQLMENIRSYQPYSDDTILFDRKTDTASEIGIWKDKETVIVQPGLPADAPSLLRYANYDDTFYFVVTNSSSSTVTIYRDPLKKPILSKQLPLKTLIFKGATNLEFSDSSQFIMAQNGKDFLTYDLDDLLTYRVVLPFEVAPGTKLEWIDSAHMQVQAADGNVYLVEYDGQNRQELVASRAGTPLFFSNDNEYLYQLINQENGKSKISSVSLVAKK